MGTFIRFMVGLWAGWIALRIVSRVLIARIAPKPAEPQIKPGSQHNDSQTLELMPCPKCGVYTTVPCTNPHCGASS